jgi:resuscitation-promoting factor RpfB
MSDCLTRGWLEAGIRLVIVMPKRIKKLKKQYSATQKRQVRRIKRIAKKPLFTIPFATFMVFLVVGMIAWVVFVRNEPSTLANDTNIVIIDHDKQRQTVPTNAKTVGELLTKLAIKLNPGDVVEPSRSTEIIGDNFRVNVYRAVPVTVIDGEHKTYAYSAAATPRSIVKQAGVTVYPEDNLTLLPTENFLTDSSIGERVIIDRATPLNLNLYGTPVAVRTHAKTVGELLKEKNIKLSQGDSVQPAQETKLAANTQVFVIRKGKQVVSQEQAIPAPQEEIEDPNLSFGTTAVRQQGTPGKKIITYEVELQNGQEIGRRVIQEVITQDPVKQIVAKGTYVNIAKDRTSVMLAAGISRSDFTYVDYIVEHESHWNHLARNASSGAYGLCQALPGSKMASAGSDWQTNPVTQLKWCSGYAQSRFGSWAGAYSYWVSHGYW